MSPTPESNPGLRYPEGWREILEAPDAIDYQMWLTGLTDLTQSRLLEEGVNETSQNVQLRWQQAIELFVDITISPEDQATSTEAEIIETALLTLQANMVEGMGWEEEGLSFIVPNMFTGEKALIDLRHLPSIPPNN